MKYSFELMGKYLKSKQNYLLNSSWIGKSSTRNPSKHTKVFTFNSMEPQAGVCRVKSRGGFHKTNGIQASIFHLNIPLKHH